MGAKVSVIVPVYNAFQYLDRFIKSLKAQSYQNFELILVDDGSDDGSGELCDSYALEDARTKVIHQKNMGVSAARNTGLAAAGGDAIIFFDADDYVKPDILKDLLNYLIAYDVQVVCCGYAEIFSDRIIERIPPAGIMTGESILQELFDATYGAVVWNKMFKADFLHSLDDADLLFPVGISNSEDFLWLVRVLQYCTREYCTDKVYYHYFRSDDRATGNLAERIDEKALSMLTAMEAIVEVCKKYSDDTCYLACRHYFNTLMGKLKISDAEGKSETSDMICGKMRPLLKYYHPRTIRESVRVLKARVILLLKRIGIRNHWILLVEGMGAK